MTDTRNVTDEFKDIPHDDIVATLDSRDKGLHIAIENLERDFNMGSIVRTANAFGVRHVHIIGSRQWNKRGAMATDKYLHVHYYKDIALFTDAMAKIDRVVYSVDNVQGSVDLSSTKIPLNAVLVFGSESNGISEQLLKSSKVILSIRQYGSTRSLNVAAAAAIAMYEWTRQR